MADCIWCERATKTCKACGQRVCPKHANKANGCCLPCLEAVQDAVRQGRCTDQAEEEEIEAIGGAEAATYGEITPLGFRALAARLGLCADDEFADLGSGLGRCVLQAAAEFDVRCSFGVEMAPSRHALAEELMETAAAAPAASRVRLLQGDCADEELWSTHLEGVTVVYASNLLFDDRLNARLARRLEGAPSVRVVASLRPFEAPACALGGGFVEATPRDLIVETSWRAPDDLGQPGALPAAGSLMYVYERVPHAGGTTTAASSNGVG